MLLMTLNQSKGRVVEVGAHESMGGMNQDLPCYKNQVTSMTSVRSNQSKECESSRIKRGPGAHVSIGIVNQDLPSFKNQVVSICSGSPEDNAGFSGNLNNNEVNKDNKLQNPHQKLPIHSKRTNLDAHESNNREIPLESARSPSRRPSYKEHFRINYNSRNEPEISRITAGNSVKASSLLNDPSSMNLPLHAEVVSTHDKSLYTVELHRFFKKYSILIACLALVAGAAIIVGVAILVPRKNTSNPTLDSPDSPVPSVSLVPTTIISGPASEVLESTLFASSTLAPTTVAMTPKPSFKKFISKFELQDAVDVYVQSKLENKSLPSSLREYGTTMNDWDVSLISNFDYLFSADRKDIMVIFNEYIGNWDTSQVTSMESIFYKAANFTGGGVGNWNVSQVTSFQWAFRSAAAFDADLGNWDVSQATSMRTMFNGTFVFKGIGVDKWNVSRVIDFDACFKDAYSFDADLSGWDTSSATSMERMFDNAAKFEGIGISNWNVEQVSDMTAMFVGANHFNANLSTWNVSNVKNMAMMFTDALNFKGNGLKNWNVAQVTDMSAAFGGASAFDEDLKFWDMSRVENTQFMFSTAESFSGSGVEHWNVSGITDMHSMFMEASNFEANLASWDVENVRNMGSIFAQATNFLGTGIEYWNVARVSNMFAMFYGTKINSNLKDWNVSSVIRMTKMFYNTPLFSGAGVESWNVSQVTDMYGMFYEAKNFDANLTLWDVSSVKDMTGMFSKTEKFVGTGLASWNINSVTAMDAMFCDAKAFDSNFISAWDIPLTAKIFC